MRLGRNGVKIIYFNLMNVMISRGTVIILWGYPEIYAEIVSNNTTFKYFNCF